MHLLLLAVALQLEPNPPGRGEAVTLTITAQGESAPLRVDIDGAAMLRRVPDGASVERVESDLHLLWPDAPERARVELVLRADDAAGRLHVTAVAGASKATLVAKPVSRNAEPMPVGRVALIALVLLLLMSRTFSLTWRHSPIAGALAAIAGIVLSVVFARMWLRDYASARDSREGSCVVTDRMLVYRGHERSKRFYSLMIAAEVDGRPRIAGDGDSSVWTERDGDAHVKLARFEGGKAYPCWWSDKDRDELLFEPRRHGVMRRSLASIVALLLIIAPGWMRPDVPRRR